MRGAEMQFQRSLWPALLCAVFLSIAVHGQEQQLSHDELQALLKRMAQNYAANGKLAQQYTSDETWHNVNFNKDGKKTLDESSKFENIFVEGLGYRRKVEENGKPLEGKAAEEEQKRYDKAVAERRAMSVAEKRHLFQTHTSFEFPLQWLATLFDNRVVGREQIEGRDTLVVESLPRADVRPSSQDEQHAMEMKEKTWVDAADAMPVRIEMEFLQDRGMVKKGSTFTLELQRMVDQPAAGGSPERSVWLLHRSVSHLSAKVFLFKVLGVTEQEWSNYKKFHVDMRLLEDSVDEAPSAAP